MSGWRHPESPGLPDVGGSFARPSGEAGAWRKDGAAPSFATITFASRPKLRNRRLAR